jgi:hypothetical protein
LVYINWFNEICENNRFHRDLRRSLERHGLDGLRRESNLSLLHWLRDNLVNWLNYRRLLNILSLLSLLDYGLNELGALLSYMDILGLLRFLNNGLY